jgi:hypothetical protein
MPLTSEDPFTGTWHCNLAKSKFSTPAPQSWTQYITASATDLSVREEISRAGRAPATVSVSAKFDGKDYPVHGSPAAEVIAYTRTVFEIVGTASRQGSVCLRETLTLSADHKTLAMSYAVFSGEKELLSGQAIFERAELVETQRETSGPRKE